MEFKRTFTKDIKSPKDVLEIDKEMQAKDANGNSIYDSYSAKYGDKFIKYSFPNNALSTVVAPAPIVANPHYVNNAPISPLNAPTMNESILTNEISSEIKTPQAEPTQCLNQCDDCKSKFADKEAELKHYKQELIKNESIIGELTETIRQLEDNVAYLTEQHGLESERANKLEIDLINKETGIDKNDMRGLCMALYNLGFDVELKFVADEE